MNCCNCIKVTPSISSDNTTVILTPSATVTKNNKESLCFRLLSSVPSAGSALPVVMVINGVTNAVYNKYGNPVIGGDIPECKCKCLKGYFGIVDNIGHISLNNYPITLNCGNVGNEIF